MFASSEHCDEIMTLALRGSMYLPHPILPGSMSIHSLIFLQLTEKHKCKNYSIIQCRMFQYPDLLLFMYSKLQEHPLLKQQSKDLIGCFLLASLIWHLSLFFCLPSWEMKCIQLLTTISLHSRLQLMCME